jgi:hypothetical protein
LKKDDVEKALKGLENISNTTQPEKGGLPLKVIIPVSLAVVSVIAIVAVVIVRRKKQVKVK